MIVLKRNSEVIAVTENPVWTKLQNNGYTVICERPCATGIVANGVTYHIAGTSENGYDTVIVDEYLDDSSILSSVKLAKIAQSKVLLKQYLENHPLEYKGAFYSVTQEKQNLLTGNLATYSVAVSIGVQPTPLTWNTTGSTCVEWSFEELGNLALAIKEYVKPLVAYQQAYEVSMNACTTLDAINAIQLDYDSVVKNA